jgi:hypothetical protein
MRPAAHDHENHRASAEPDRTTRARAPRRSARRSDKRWAVLEDELTVAGGLLTPTQKVRRRAVTEQHRATIDALSADQGIAAH